jgi:hypothetical protein
MSKVMFDSIDTKSTFITVDKPKRIIYKNILPFKVRFSSIGITGVSGLVPPIGIAVIGVNNYIL